MKKDANEILSDLVNITDEDHFNKWSELIMKRKVKETSFKEYTTLIIIEFNLF